MQKFPKVDLTTTTNKRGRKRKSKYIKDRNLAKNVIGPFTRKSNLVLSLVNFWKLFGGQFEY